MKKLFISQPMKGLNNEEILKVREKIKKEAEEKLGEPLKLIDSFFEDYLEEITKSIPVWYLGLSLMKLSQADIVYFVGGWEKARGCRIEHKVAEEYGLRYIEEIEF